MLFDRAKPLWAPANRLERGEDAALPEPELRGLEGRWQLLRQVGGFVATFSEGGFGTNAESTPSAPKSTVGTGNTSRHGEQAVSTTSEVSEATSSTCPSLTPQLVQSTAALDTKTTNLNPFRAELVGIGVCWGEDPLGIDLDVARRGGMEAQQLRAAAEPRTASAVIASGARRTGAGSGT